MVYFAPPSKQQKKKPTKDQAAEKEKKTKTNKPAAVGSDPNTVRSKKELLAELTRQAEENTRILERERAQLLALGIQVSGPASQSRNHIYHSTEAKVFDPNQVPGLTSSQQDLHQRQRVPIDQGAPTKSQAAGYDAPFSPGVDNDFPDTPYRRVGEVISFGGQSGDTGNENSNRQLPTILEDGTFSGKPHGPHLTGVQLPEPCFEVPRPTGGQPWHAAQDPSATKAAKQAAYRQELLEQIELQRSRRESEMHASTRAGGTEDAAKQRYGGGGGHPLRDTNGAGDAWASQRAMAGAHHGQQQPWGGENQPPLPGQRHSVPSPEPAPHPGHSGKLALHIPGAIDGAMLTPEKLRGSYPPPGQQLHVAAPSPLAPGLSQASPASATTPGGHRFMSALNTLLPGPSEQQRNQKEQARLQLIKDLEEQVRLKQQRIAQEKAAEQARTAREEAELRSHYSHHQGPSPAAPQLPAATAAAVMPALPPPPHVGAPHTMAAAPAPAPQRRRAKHVIDAPWLDAPPPPPLASETPVAMLQHGRRAGQPYGLDDGPGVPSVPLMRTSHASHAVASDALQRSAEYHHSPQLADPVELRRSTNAEPWGSSNNRPIDDGLIQINPLPTVHRSGGDGAVGALLQQMQSEQQRLREEMARQAAAMAQLRQEAFEAATAREQALGELRAVKAMLGKEGGSRETLSEHFVVSTHLVPRTINTIQEEELPTTEGSWWRHSTDPGPYPEDTLDMLRRQASYEESPAPLIGRHGPAARPAASPIRHTSRSQPNTVGRPGALPRPSDNEDLRRPMGSPAIIRSLSPPKAARKQMLKRGRGGDASARAGAPDQRPGRH